MSLNLVHSIYLEPYTYMDKGMVVNWLRAEETDALYWRKEGDTTWQSIPSTKTDFAGNADGAFDEPEKIHRVVLDNLEGGTGYEFYFEDDVRGVQKFKTLPTNPQKKLTIVSAADMQYMRDNYNDPVTRALNEKMMDMFPDLILLNGDYVNCEGELYVDEETIVGPGTTKGPRPADSPNAWKYFLSYLTEDFITPDGYRIPALWQVGNHEVTPHHAGSNFTYPATFMLLLFWHWTNNDGERSNITYKYVTAGNYLCIISLDSQHMTDLALQTTWLNQIKDKVSKRYKYVLAQWHRSHYPVLFGFNESGYQEMRRDWMPLMQDMNVRFITTGHDHVWFKSKPIFVDTSNGDGVADEGNPKSIICVGNGGWSSNFRLNASNTTQFYVDEFYGTGQGTEKIHNFWWFQLNRDGIVAGSKNEFGTPITSNTLRKLNSGVSDNVVYTL